MRKQDYLTLARIIREEREKASQTVAGERNTPEQKDRARGAFAALATVAERFGTLGSVDKIPFLQECKVLK